MPFSNVINGRNTMSDHLIGMTVASAVSVGNWSAMAFGTSSPMMSWTAVSTNKTSAADTDRAVTVSDVEPLGDERGERRAHRDLRVRAEHEARQRDADLRDADVPIERGGAFDEGKKEAREEVPVLALPADATPAHADRPELGGHV